MKRLCMVIFCIFITVSAFAGEAADSQKEMHSEDLHDAGDTGKTQDSLRKVWARMSAKLLAGDIDGALGFFAEPGREKYRKTFSDMGKEGLASFFAKAALEFSEFRDGTAECFAVGTFEGMQFSYPVSFKRNAEGVWMISDF